MNIEQINDNGDYICSNSSEQRLKELSANAVGQFIYMSTDGDEVKVIRCKDCKYYKKSFHANRRDYCDKCSTLEHTEYVNPTDFCSRGERK